MSSALSVLKKYPTCDGSREWAKGRSIRAAWTQCERADWMIFAISRLDIDTAMPLAVCIECIESYSAFLDGHADSQWLWTILIGLASPRLRRLEGNIDRWNQDIVAWRAGVLQSRTLVFSNRKGRIWRVTMPLLRLIDAVRSAGGSRTEYTLAVQDALFAAKWYYERFPATPNRLSVADIIRLYVTATDIEAACSRKPRTTRV